MRVGVPILAVFMALGFHTCRRGQGDPASTSRASVDATERQSRSALTALSNLDPAGSKIDFGQVRSILEARCRPCHFAGGTMYQRLPFDRQATITTLGTKMFTRIKDEKEQRLIREFLSQQAPSVVP
jgi:hypothetical protein